MAVLDLDEDSTKATLKLSDGSNRSADIVLVADGMLSHLRPKALGDLNLS